MLVCGNYDASFLFITTSSLLHVSVGVGVMTEVRPLATPEQNKLA